MCNRRRGCHQAGGVVVVPSSRLSLDYEEGGEAEARNEEEEEKEKQLVIGRKESE